MGSVFIQVYLDRLFDKKAIAWANATYSELNPQIQTGEKSATTTKKEFLFVKKYIWKRHLQYGKHFLQASIIE